MQIATHPDDLAERPFALHIGVRPHHLPLIVLLDNVQDIDGNYAIACIDGDTWEEWGESLPTINSEEGYTPAFHVLFGVTGRAHAFAVLEMLVLSDLGMVPMRYPDYQKGTLASLTLRETWSESLFNLAIGPADTDGAEA